MSKLLIFLIKVGSGKMPNLRSLIYTVIKVLAPPFTLKHYANIDTLICVGL